jgi:3-hydroxyisobutyrate dehydrogenase-like beta-hydroxyacid dehydrogenase
MFGAVANDSAIESPESDRQLQHGHNGVVGNGRPDVTPAAMPAPPVGRASDLRGRAVQAFTPAAFRKLRCADIRFPLVIVSCREDDRRHGTSQSVDQDPIPASGMLFSTTTTEEHSMQLRKIGLMTPGDMGQAVAMQIQARGFSVLTALEGRSDRSRLLAREAGLEDAGTIARLVTECDAVLSVMNPGAALDFARKASEALRTTGRHTLFVDCNAISPRTMKEIAGLIETAGGRCLDGAIIGPPPRNGAAITLFVSGPDAETVLPLGGPHLRVKVVSPRLGDASALKMCSGALTKGTQTLWLEVLVTARRLGVHELLHEELCSGSRSAIYDWVLEELPAMPPKAYRWVPEMQEVAATLGAGITPKTFEGITEVCRFVSESALAGQTPEQARMERRSGIEVVQSLAQSASSF